MDKQQTQADPWQDVGRHWTPEEVRKELPSIMVLHNGRLYSGQVLGRKCQFATVSIKLGTDWIDAQFSWEAVTTAKNGQHCLTL